MKKLIALLIPLIFSLASCNSMFFYPVKEQIIDPKSVGIDYQVKKISDGLGPDLNGWLLPAKSKAKATIIHLHGNAENISTHVGSVYWLPKEGFNVFTFDYRGYGASEGEPTFEGIHSDAQRAINFIAHDAELGGLPLILFGQSLGGSVAIYTASKQENKKLLSAVIVESPFKGYRKVARDKLKDFWLTYPISYPLSFLVSADYDASDAVADISPIPLLIMHPKGDQTVLYYHGKDLFDLAKEPKEIWEVNSTDHISTLNEQNNRLLFTQKIDQLIKVEDNLEKNKSYTQLIK